MAIRSFKDLVVWQRSHDFVPLVYTHFSQCRDFAFKDQIQRASISMSNNIAEGYGRKSNKALAHFLTIARGSAAEVESMLLLATKLSYLEETVQYELLAELDEISKLLTAFKSKVTATITLTANS